MNRQEAYDIINGMSGLFATEEQKHEAYNILYEQPEKTDKKR